MQYYTLFWAFTCKHVSHKSPWVKWPKPVLNSTSHIHDKIIILFYNFYHFESVISYFSQWNCIGIQELLVSIAGLTSEHWKVQLSKFARNYFINIWLIFSMTKSHLNLTLWCIGNISKTLFCKTKRVFFWSTLLSCCDVKRVSEQWVEHADGVGSM